MSGGTKSDVQVVLRDPLNKSQTIDYTFCVNDTALGKDWLNALDDNLINQRDLEKNFCFLGFPTSPRNIQYLCKELNYYIDVINEFNLTDTWFNHGLDEYYIEEYFSQEAVQFEEKFYVAHPTIDSTGKIIKRPRGLNPKHEILNRLHNHFEVLQGTVWAPSEYYRLANADTKYAIRQLNLLCHELENFILGSRKAKFEPNWVRPSQITTFLHAPRYDLTNEHRQGFITNSYDRRFGHVYLHWAQIGKTLFEVFRDENAPKLNVGSDPGDISIGSGATCEAINALKFYSGEFDVEWGSNVIEGSDFYWHDNAMKRFREWLADNQIDYAADQLSLGYLELGHVDVVKSFGTDDRQAIWQILGEHLDIYKIEHNGISATYDYCWSDSDFKEKQFKTLGI